MPVRVATRLCQKMLQLDIKFILGTRPRMYILRSVELSRREQIVSSMSGQNIELLSAKSTTKLVSKVEYEHRSMFKCVNIRRGLFCNSQQVVLTYCSACEEHLASCSRQLDLASEALLVSVAKLVGLFCWT